MFSDVEVQNLHFLGVGRSAVASARGFDRGLCDEYAVSPMLRLISNMSPALLQPLPVLIQAEQHAWWVFIFLSDVQVLLRDDIKPRTWL